MCLVRCNLTMSWDIETLFIACSRTEMIYVYIYEKAQYTVQYMYLPVLLCSIPECLKKPQISVGMSG